MMKRIMLERLYRSKVYAKLVDFFWLTGELSDKLWHALYKRIPLDDDDEQADLFDEYAEWILHARKSDD